MNHTAVFREPQISNWELQINEERNQEESSCEEGPREKGSREEGSREEKIAVGGFTSEK